MPPYLPDLLTIPMALVDSIHFFGDKVKAFEPACFLNPSNSTGLKPGLFSDSHSPKNSIISLFLSQFFITSSGESLLYRAISVSEIYSFSKSEVYIPISILFACMVPFTTLFIN